MPSITEGLVTTIIPVYNRPVLIHEAVESVLAQTHRPIEVIIVDDGSTDETSHIIENLVRENPREIRSIHQPNLGPGLAREAGRLVAQGEYIQYLDSDDLLLPTKFEEQVSGLRANPHCAVAYGKTRYYEVGDSPSDKPLKRTGERITTMFPSFLKSRWWSTSTPLFRRDVVDRAGAWQNLINEEDWEYDCRVASQDVRLYFQNEFVSHQRDHDGERLNTEGSSQPQKLKDRAKAHQLIYHHASAYGLNHTIPEMQHYSRELFLLSRQCGAVGLLEEARGLFEYAKQASGEQRSNGIDFRLYYLFSKLFGWKSSSKLAFTFDRLRN